MPSADGSARVTREPVSVKRGGHEPIPHHEKAPLEISARYLTAGGNQEDFSPNVTIYEPPERRVYEPPERGVYEPPT